jgi:transcription antitermination factor NusG
VDSLNIRVVDVDHSGTHERLIHPVILSDHEAVNVPLEWFAFRVLARHEKSVALRLREKCQECFAPLIRKSRMWVKRLVIVELPLISGYVFCRSHKLGLFPILDTPGIIDVARDGCWPVPIPETEISTLQRVIDAAVPIESCLFVETGETIEIQSGPFAGIIGIVSHRSKGEHLILSVSAVRRSVLVQIDTSRRALTPSAA